MKTSDRLPIPNEHLRVFISYARLDRDLAHALVKELRRIPGIEVRIDERVLSPGDDFAEEVTTNVITSDVTIVLWTPRSSQRDWVVWEAHASYFTGVRVIPVKVGQCVALPYPLSRLHSVSLESERYRETRSVFKSVAREIRRLAFGKRAQFELWKIACHPESELEFDDDAFYRNTIPNLGRSSGHALFISGTPAVILPGEASTANRIEYLKKMLSVYGCGTTRNSATYLTNYDRVSRHLHRYHEASQWREYTRNTADLIHSSVFDISTSRNLRWVPSGYIDDNVAVLVLKYPEDIRQEDTMTVLTARGKHARSVKRRLRHIVQTSLVTPQHS
ncbi:MAG: toll/interleukin-1 receptor domain-containing protein [Methylococcales bacterium]